VKYFQAIVPSCVALIVSELLSGARAWWVVTTGMLGGGGGAGCTRGPNTSFLMPPPHYSRGNCRPPRSPPTAGCPVYYKIARHLSPLSTRGWGKTTISASKCHEYYYPMGVILMKSHLVLIQIGDDIYLFIFLHFFYWHWEQNLSWHVFQFAKQQYHESIVPSPLYRLNALQLADFCHRPH
jgi:hypothetical protein